MDGPPEAGRSETLAIRWIGMWPGESANAQPFDAPPLASNPGIPAMTEAIRRSSWYPVSTPSVIRSQDWAATPSSS